MLRPFFEGAIYVVMAVSTIQAIELTDGLSVKYPNDVGIAKDSTVLFTENFETGNLSGWQEKKGTASLTMEHAHSGRACLAIPMARGKNPPPGEVCLYSYFPDMAIDPKMSLYWGNQFFPLGPSKGAAASSDRIVPELDRWQCWEFMIQANSAPEASDGMQAMWVDGKSAGTFTNLRWRTEMDLKINTLWLEHYGYDKGDPTKQFWKDEQSVWFDDVVVATQYIGPMQDR